MTTNTNTNTATTATIDTDHLTTLSTKSAQIRYLYPILGTYYKVAKYLGIRPQHVRNVMVTPIKNPK
jgi:hypothetical protein